MEDEIVSRSILYSFFETGDIPTQEDFADLINSYVHRREDGVFIFKPDEEIKRFGVGLPQPAYRLGIKAEGETEKLISLHDLDENHKWSVNLNPETGGNRGLNIAQETADGSITRFFIQDASGNIGIGTLYPEQKVHIEHGSPSSITGIKLFNTATVENNGWLIGHVNEIETERDGGLSFQSQLEESIERLLITTSGNIGINEPSPYTKLHVSMSNSDPKAVIALDETTGIVNIGPITENIVMDFRGIQARTGEFIGDVLDMKTAVLNLQRLGGELLIHGDTILEESKKIIITEDGSVGIGTTSPAEKIDLDGAIKIGNTETSNEGTIRWTGEDFQGYDGLDWESLTGKAPYTKGGTYIFVKGLGTPLENGESLMEAINEANKLSIELNTKNLPLEEIQPDWYVIFGNEMNEWNGGNIRSISSNEIVLSDLIAGDFSSLPFIIQKLEFYMDKRTKYKIVFDGNFPVIDSVVYNPEDGSVTCTLSVNFPESFQYQLNNSDATRVKVVAAPGQYLLSKTIVLSNEYVDLISLTGNPDVELDLTDDHFYTGQVDLTGFGGDIIEVVNDPFVILNIEEQLINLNFALSIDNSCIVKGIKTKIHYSKTLEAILQLTKLEMYATNIYPLPIDVKPVRDDYTRIAPTVENCRGGHFSFGINLDFENDAFIDGTYINNEAWYASFGGRCHIWGTYENNKARLASFGINGVVSGRFMNNIGSDHCFGGGDGEAWGYFSNCRSGNRSFGGYEAGGTFIDCIAGDKSFGKEIASGEFINCYSGNESFGRNAATGIFTNCTGGEWSFGASGTLTGKLYYCRITSGKFPMVSDTGRTVYCIDGYNEHNNQ